MIKGIAAVDRNGALGLKGTMPWGDRPLDGKHFKSLTQGHIVLMGRKTYESMGKRPLPDRENVVLTRNPELLAGASLSEDSGPGGHIRVVSSPDEAVALAQQSTKDLWVIGGAQVYRLMLPWIESFYLTIINAAFEADVFFPDLDDYGVWEKHVISTQAPTEKSPYPLTFVRFDRV